MQQLFHTLRPQAKAVELILAACMHQQPIIALLPLQILHSINKHALYS